LDIKLEFLTFYWILDAFSSKVALGFCCIPGIVIQRQDYLMQQKKLFRLYVDGITPSYALISISTGAFTS